MEIPFDSSDLACLVQADWYEEFGDIGFAEDIREEVELPPINQFVYEYGYGGSRVGGVNVGGVGGVISVGGVGGISYVGSFGVVGGDIGW
jgi:hypothetical protein